VILGWNRAATRVFGYEPKEIIGQSILCIMPPELHYEEEEFMRKLRAGEPIEHFETVRLRKSGEKFSVSVTISPIKDDQGRVIGSAKIARDISDRNSIDEIRFRLASIVDSADDAIISKDLNGVIRTWNQAAQRMFGYTPDEIIGHSILRLIPEDLHYEEHQILSKLRAGERLDHYETTRLTKAGAKIEISATISPIKDESGRVIGASKIARNISDRKRMERLLVQSEKIAATGRMAAAIAHEINNPLESVMNLIFLARQNSPPESTAGKLLLTAEQEIERVAHIARQTLGYYRDTGTPAEVYLRETIQNVLTVYNAKVVAAGITVHTQFNDLQKITVRKGEILQVFSNVIANSIDAMRDGGVLHISTRKLSEGIQVVVRDNGVGISQEHLPNIFEPFFTTKGDLGTGIGLWVARQLVEARGGQISVASSAEKANSGTTVTIFLPFAIPAPRVNGEAEKGNHSSRS
jgi:PAS domain S-box-containing protein